MSAPKVVRVASAREVINKSRKIAALAAVLQSEEAVRLVAALKSKDSKAVYAALKSKDTTAVVAALRAKDAKALAAALKLGVPPAKSGNPSDVRAEAAVGAPSASSAGPANVRATPARTTPGGMSNVPTGSRFQDAVALMASLKPADKTAVMAALRARDTDALKAVLKSASVAPIIADLKAKGLILPAKAAKSKAPTPTTPGSLPVTSTVTRPGPAISVNVPVTRKPGDVAAISSAVLSQGVHSTVSLTSATKTVPVAAPKLENTTASKAVPMSDNSAAQTASLGPRATAVFPKSNATLIRGLTVEGKVSAAVRTKSAAVKAAAAKLKAATTTLAAKKAKKWVDCQQPVLRVYEMDMRCPWHTEYVADERNAALGKLGLLKEEIKELKEEPDEDHTAECFGHVNKKMKMELDELTPDIGSIVGEVEMKTEANDEAADDAASVTGSGNQADLSTESTLSATSPRVDDVDMDDDCRNMDMDMDAGMEELMLQPPLGADDADLVAVAQGAAMVGAEEEVAVIQQDDDSLTNPPVAIDEVEVS